jgi:hypothetical protein
MNDSTVSDAVQVPVTQTVAQEVGASKVLLENLMIELARARREAADAKSDVNMLFEQVREDHPELFDAQKKADEELAKVEGLMREALLERYKATGDKKPVAGGEVKIFNVYDYDAGEALIWAVDHRMALQLDKTAFNGICKNDSTRPPFVAAREEPRAQIATDLSKFYGVEVASEVQ